MIEDTNTRTQRPTGLAAWRTDWPWGVLVLLYAAYTILHYAHAPIVAVAGLFVLMVPMFILIASPPNRMSWVNLIISTALAALLGGLIGTALFYSFIS